MRNKHIYLAGLLLASTLISACNTTTSAREEMSRERMVTMSPSHQGTEKNQATKLAFFLDKAAESETVSLIVQNPFNTQLEVSLVNLQAGNHVDCGLHNDAPLFIPANSTARFNLIDVGQIENCFGWNYRDNQWPGELIVNESSRYSVKSGNGYTNSKPIFTSYQYKFGNTTGIVNRSAFFHYSVDKGRL